MELARQSSFRGAIRRPLGSNALLLAAIVLTSFVARTASAWVRSTPTYFQDEYLYAELARSLAESGRPLVRGVAVGFPALLHPLLTAPAWLADDVALAFGVVQAVGALAMSLAAVPVFLLATYLGLGRRLALASAGLAVAVPGLLLSSWVMAEPIAYPLALAAVALGTRALAGGGLGAQLAFVGCSALATLARIQLAALLVSFLAALLVVGVRERRLRQVVREQAVVVALLVLAAGTFALVGVGRALGSYGALLAFEVQPSAVLAWAGAHAMVLLYASSWIVMPAAVLGLGLALWQPRSRRELSFAALSALFAIALLLESALVVSNDAVERVEERYVVYLSPLAVLAFGVYATRGWPLRALHALVASVFLAVSAVVPIAGYISPPPGGASPFLYSAAWLAETLGGVVTASVAVAAAAAVLSLASAAVSARPRLATPVVAALALAVAVASSTAAALFDMKDAAKIRAKFLPAERSWVDRAGVGQVTLLAAPNGDRNDALLQMFWNRSITRALRLPGAAPIDSFDSSLVHVGDDGSLYVGNRLVEAPVLVDGYGTTIRFRDGKAVAHSPHYTLWAASATPRLALYAPGRYDDGWLAGEGGFKLWPRSPSEPLSGWLAFTLAAPATRSVDLRFRVVAGEARARDVRLSNASREHVRLRVCSHGPWQAEFAAEDVALVDGRIVSARASEPVFEADAGACDERKTPSSGLLGETAKPHDA